MAHAGYTTLLCFKSILPTRLQASKPTFYDMSSVVVIDSDMLGVESPPIEFKPSHPPALNSKRLETQVGVMCLPVRCPGQVVLGWTLSHAIDGIADSSS